MAEQAATYPIAMMCRVLGIGRAGYYRWRQRQTQPPLPRTQRHRALTAAILALFADGRGRVGRRPMRHLLAAQDLPCSPGLVHRIMAEQGVVAQRRRAGQRTTRRDPAAQTAHITTHCLDPAGQRCFTSATPGAITVGDITYLPTREGWLYLAVVLDLATRAVVGWALRPSLHTELVSAALTMARQHGHVAAGTIFHSDRGSQYTATAFQDQCAALGITQSMGATGVCWDNAGAEAFFATLKADLQVEVATFTSHQAARQWTIPYIEGWYNRRRPHTWNNGAAPLVAWAQATAPLPAVSLS